MAFFTDKFLNDRREELLRSVDRFQYQLNGGAWQTGTVNSKEIIGTNVVVFVNVPNFGQADTITGVRVYDINGALAGQQSISLKRTSLNVALLRFTSSKALPLTTAPSLRRRRGWNALASTSACHGLKCISATRIPLGSGAPTRTPTA